MQFTTETGSVYEINTDSKTIRRLEGNRTPTSRVGDGWKTYHYTCPDPIEVGKSILIVWGQDVPLLEETIIANQKCAVPTTLTSMVVSIKES